MRVTAVESSALATVTYVESQEVLQLEFRSREVYEYLGVPTELHQALLAAISKGAYFNQAIRPWFPGRRVSRPVRQTAEAQTTAGEPR